MLNEQQQNLVSEHLGYIVRLVNALRGRYEGYMDYDELLSAAYLGACSAAERFDPNGKSSARTWLVSRAKGQILDDLRHKMGKQGTAKNNAEFVVMDLDSLAHRPDTSVEDDDEVNHMIRSIAPHSREKRLLMQLKMEGLLSSECGDVLGVGESRIWQLWGEVRDAAA